MVKIALPEKVEEIIKVLIEHGFEAYAVGGCVRDSILGKEPEDWDITTSARPEEVKQLFRRTVDTGIQHGTITVMLEKNGFEVTTYRIDGDYEDGRHPTNVEFTSNLEEDLKRRDFTINAMAYNSSTGLVDCFDGIGDLERKIIRCVGSPEDRFEEDALRILRAVRFAAQLGFAIEDKTQNAIVKKAETLEKISAERIRVELSKLILSSNPGHLRTASETGICRAVLPEMDEMLKQAQYNPHHIYSVGEHTIKTLEMLNKIYREHSPASTSLGSEKALELAYDKKQHLVLAWTMLLHDVGKPACHTRGEDGYDHFHGHAEKSAEIGKEILRRLRFDNYTIDLAVRLIRWHDYRYTLNETHMRKCSSKIGPDIMELLFVVQQMDVLAQNPETWECKLEQLKEAKQLFRSICERGECLTLKELALNGKDLIEVFQAKPGPAIGETLQVLLEYVLNFPEENEKDRLITFLKKNPAYLNKR